MAFLIKSQGYVVVCEGGLICPCLHLLQGELSSIYLPNEKIEKAEQDLLIFALPQVEPCEFTICIQPRDHAKLLLKGLVDYQR